MQRCKDPRAEMNMVMVKAMMVRVVIVTVDAVTG